jgi:hypothetical protein
MAKTTFVEAYEKALRLQAAGDFNGISELIQQAYRSGLPQDELQILSALAEGAFQFQQPNGSR